jgi:adenine-specific DNA glycosylase
MVLSYPCIQKKPKKKILYTKAFVLFNLPKTKIFLLKENEKNLLKDLLTVPMSPWECTKDNFQSASFFPSNIKWIEIPSPIKHEFTHITLNVQIVKAFLEEDMPGMLPLEELPLHPLSSLVKKIIQKAESL